MPGIYGAKLRTTQGRRDDAGLRYDPEELDGGEFSGSSDSADPDLPSQFEMEDFGAALVQRQAAVIQSLQAELLSARAEITRLNEEIRRFRAGLLGEARTPRS